MRARDLMTPRPAMIAAGDTIPHAAELMRLLNVGMLPVVEDLASKHLVGIITDRDIVVRHVALGHGNGSKVRDHMTRGPLVTVSPDAAVGDIADRMIRNQIRRIPVVDARGTVLGVVAQADLATHVGPTDPAIVERVVEGISRPGALVH